MGANHGRNNTWLRVSGTLSLVVLALGLHATSANAEFDPPHTEFFTGFEASDNYVSGYVGGGYAFGKGLYENGLRLRAVGSYSRYHYDGTLFSNGFDAPMHFEGDGTFAAALVGYPFTPGTVIVKLFAGIEAEDQRITPRDPNNSVQGNEIGLRLLAEICHDISPRMYFSADAAYGTAFQ